MTTMRKDFRLQVQAHIIDCLSEEESPFLKEQLQNTVDEFKSWYTPVTQKLTPNRQEAFSSFLMCLPSCLSVEYTYYNINEAVKNWFVNVGMSYKEPKDISKASETYLALIYREFTRLCKEQGVTF